MSGINDEAVEAVLQIAHDAFMEEPQAGFMRSFEHALTAVVPVLRAEWERETVARVEAERATMVINNAQRAYNRGLDAAVRAIKGES